MPVFQSADEAARLATLHRYRILDTPSEPAFDDLNTLAAQVCDTPIALITLLDAHRQWFKARKGVVLRETPREHAFCVYALARTDLLEVADALADPRFDHNPLVLNSPHIRFYAGAPLTTPDGYVLGTLCVLDYVPRRLEPHQRRSLATLAGAVITQLELRLQALEREKVERLLQAKDEQFRQLANHLHEIIWMYDCREQRVLYASTAYETVYGRSREQLYANPADWLKAVYPVDQASARKAHQQASKCEFDVSYRIRHPSGEQRWIRDRGFPVRNPKGEIYRIAGIAEDITEAHRLQQLQADLAQQSRHTLVGELASGLAHEINQPLTAIITYTDTGRTLLNQHRDTPKAVKHLLRAIAEQGRRAGEIIQRLRSLIRKTGPYREITHLNDVVREVACLVKGKARDQQVELVLELAEQLPPIKADIIQIQQVILHLLNNSIEAMATQNSSPRRLLVRTASTEHTVEVSVTDTGPGLPLGAEGSIFDPFFTTKTNSMGLGLTICQSIVNTHGGHLLTSLETQQGSTFRFTLPTLESDNHH